MTSGSPRLRQLRLGRQLSGLFHISKLQRNADLQLNGSSLPAATAGGVTVLKYGKRKKVPEYVAELRAHNDEQSISQLPNELLCHIFAEGYLSPGTVQSSQTVWTCCDSKRYIAQVCSRWREIALECPNMWCEVDLSNGSRWINEVLRRCQDLPIEVYISRGTKAERLALVFRTRRIRGVYGHIKDGGLAVKVLDAIQEVEVLDEVNLIFPESGHFKGSRQLLTPRLRRLWLTGPSIPLLLNPNFPLLTCLHVTHPWHSKTAPQWLAIIRRLPLLHELLLRHCIKVDDDPRSDFVGFEPEILPPHPMPINLRYLKKLELRGSHWACGFIFRALLIPASCALTFMTHDANMGPTVDALVAFLKSNRPDLPGYASPFHRSSVHRSLLLRIGATQLRLQVFEREVSKLYIKLLYEDCYEYRMGIAGSVMERLLCAVFKKFQNIGGFNAFTLSLSDLGESSQKIEAWSYWFIKSAWLLRGVPNVQLLGIPPSHKVLDFLKRETVLM